MRHLPGSGAQKTDQNRSKTDRFSGYTSWYIDQNHQKSRSAVDTFKRGRCTNTPDLKRFLWRWKKPRKREEILMYLPDTHVPKNLFSVPCFKKTARSIKVSAHIAYVFVRVSPVFLQKSYHPPFRQGLRSPSDSLAKCLVVEICF